MIQKFFYRLAFFNYKRVRYRYMHQFLGLNPMKQIVKGLPIFYFSSQNKKPNLVLLHGLLDASFGFRKLVPYLQREWNCIAIDLPSFGKSQLPKIEAIHKISFYTELLYDFFQHQNFKQITLLGHSMGGLIAQHLALKDMNLDQRIQSLCLLSPGNSPHDKRDEFRNILFPKNTAEVQRLLGYLYNNEIPEISENNAKALLYSWKKKEYEYLATNTINTEKEVFFGDKIKVLRVPTLIISGEKDEITPISSVRRMRSWIKGSKLELVANAKHAIHLEYPSEVAERISKHKKYLAISV
ncbi:MAG: alpha/beta hydrolase [Leptospiraceae bacterium]|nr:alpha/beta hydrolase [Leptospiraceae bacterium]